MTPNERQKRMKQADTMAELLASACEVSLSKGKEMESRINALENFFEKNGFSRAKPRKMAVLYVMMRHGHRPTTVEKWWGKVDSSYWSFSADSGQEYLKDIEQLIDEEVDNYDGQGNPGYAVYEPRKDPLEKHFNISSGSRNAKLGSFGD